MSDQYLNVLRVAAPVGTVVSVETVSPGCVRLYVPTAEFEDGDAITTRAADLLGLPCDGDRDVIESTADVVALLAERLHGDPRALSSTALPRG